jgi:hypothetical protein
LTDNIVLRGYVTVKGKIEIGIEKAPPIRRGFFTGGDRERGIILPRKQ